MTLFKFLLVTFVALGLSACANNQSGEPPRFNIQDSLGATVSAKPYPKKLSLVFFGYTYCPDICPTGLQAFAQTMDMLGEDAKHIQPIFVTIDPERDTASLMEEYVSNFHDSFIGVTGSLKQISALAKVYEAEYSKAYYMDEDEPDGVSYLMDHTGWIYLVSPGGFMTPEKDLLELWGHGIDPQELADGIREFLPPKL